MMSSMSFNPQPEFFVRSLKRRLQSLAPEHQISSNHTISPPRDILERSTSSEDCHEVFGNKEQRIRKILERGLRTCDGYVVKMSPAFPLPGTTFPPNRFINEDYLRAKFHSQSDFHAKFKVKKPEVESGYGTENSNNSSGNEVSSAPDAGDSDLFFDFDIGSPEHTDSDEDHHRVINVINNMMDTENGHVDTSDSDISPSFIGPNIEIPALPHSPDHSTAYGSTSSGLSSDSDTPSPSVTDDNDRLEHFVEGFSLHPEDWIKTQQSIFAKLDKSTSVTPVISPHNRSPVVEIPPVTSPTTTTSEETEKEISGSDENEEEEEEESSTSRDDSSSCPSDLDLEGKEIKICIGTEEKSVAHSKLQSLLAQLEKGKDHSLPERGCHSLKVRKEVITTSGPLSSSPANFSFLVGSLPGAEGKGLSRAHLQSQSTPDMTELDKIRCTSASPRPFDEGSTDALTSSQIDIIDEEEDKKSVYRKCSSLRSGKTPPTTPGRRKIVRFADVFGLDLADVKTFLDEVPRVPRSAFKDLKDAELSDIESDSGSELHFPVQPPTGPPTLPSFNAPSTPTIAPLFNQPSGSSGFFNNLRDKKVSLESAYMSDLRTIKGTIRVVNLDFNKKVVVRYTTDDWKTTSDVDGVYLNGSCDGFSDKFNFSIDYSVIAGMVGKRLQFCLKFECAGNDYWDNNSGRNYVFQCFGPSPVASYFSTSSSFRRPTEPRKKSPPFSAPVATPQSAPRGTNGNNNHFSTFSHSPAMNDDPWLRYL